MRCRTGSSSSACRTGSRSPLPSRARWLGAGLVGAEASPGRVQLGLAGCLLLATTPWLTPWYVIWALPFAAAEDDRRAQLLALGFCAYLLPQTVPL